MDISFTPCTCTGTTPRLLSEDVPTLNTYTLRQPRLEVVYIQRESIHWSQRNRRRSPRGTLAPVNHDRIRKRSSTLQRIPSGNTLPRLPPTTPPCPSLASFARQSTESKLDSVNPLPLNSVHAVPAPRIQRSSPLVPFLPTILWAAMEMRPIEIFHLRNELCRSSVECLKSLFFAVLTPYTHRYFGLTGE